MIGYGGERDKEEGMEEREKSSLYYFIGLYVRIKNRMLSILLNKLVK